MKKPKNTICLWFDKDAQDAARFYAATFPNSEVTAVRHAPADYPGGRVGAIGATSTGEFAQAFDAEMRPRSGSKPQGAHEHEAKEHDLPLVRQGRA